MCVWLLIVWIRLQSVLHVLSSDDVFKDLNISFYDDIKSENSLELHNFTFVPNKNDVSETIDITTSPNTKNSIIHEVKSIFDTVTGSNETAVNFQGKQSVTKGLIMIKSTGKDNINKTETGAINQNKTKKILNDHSYIGLKRRYKKNELLNNVTSTDVTRFRRALDPFTVTPIINTKYDKRYHTNNERNYKKPNKTQKISYTKSSKFLSSPFIKYFSTTPPTQAKTIPSPKSSVKKQFKLTTREEKPAKKQLLSEGNEIASKFRELKNLGAELLGVDKDYVWPSPEQENTNQNKSYSNNDQNYEAPRVEDYTAKHLEQKVVIRENNKLVPEPEEITKGNRNFNNNFKSINSYNVNDVPKVNEIGVNRNILEYTNNYGGGRNRNPSALESSPVSYSYPKEYIYEVLASPGIPEAVNFRTSNVSSVKPDLFLRSQTTVHDIFLDVDPEMFNLYKRNVRKNILKIAEPIRLVPEPKIIHSSKKIQPRVLEVDDFTLFTTQQKWQPPTTKDKAKISNDLPVKTFSEILEEDPTQIPKEEVLREQNAEVSSTPYGTRITPATHTPVTASTTPFNSSTASAIKKQSESEFIPYYDTDYDSYQSNLSTTEHLPTMQEAITMQEELIAAYRANEISTPFLRATAEVLNVTTTRQSESPRERWWTLNNLSTIDPFYTTLKTLPKEDKQLSTASNPISDTVKEDKTTTQVTSIVKVLQTQTQTFAARLDLSFNEQLELERKKLEEGHFTYIVYKFMEFIMEKSPAVLAKRLLDQLLPATVVWYRLRPNMYKLGEPFTKGVHTFFRHLRQSSPETLQKTVSSFYRALKVRHDAFSPELNYLFSIMDKIYTQDEINKIYIILKEVKNYPNTTNSAKQVIFHLLEKVFVEPFHKLGPTKRRHKLVENLNIYISYKYFNGTQIFIPENALRRKIEEDSSVDANRRKLKRSNINLVGIANAKISINLMKNKLALTTKDTEKQDNKEDKQGTSERSALHEDKKLNAKLNKKKMSTKSSMLINKNIVSATYNTLKEKSQVTRTLKQGIVINPDKDLEKSRQVIKDNVEKVDSLSAENFKYMIEKRLPGTKIREQISTLRKNKKPKFLKKNIAAQHKSFMKKSIPKFDEYISLNTKEFLEIIKKGDSRLSNNKNKSISPVSRKINNIKKQKSKSRHQTQQLNKNKKRVVEKYHSQYETYTKVQLKKKIKKQRNEKHVIKANKKLRLSNKKNAIIQKTSVATTMKRLNLLKKDKKSKLRDHKLKQTTTKRNKLLIDKFSEKKVNKYLTKPDFDVETSENFPQANRSDSDSHWYPTGNYIDVENDSSSSDWAAQKHFFVDNKEKVIKESFKNNSRNAIVKKNTKTHLRTKKETTRKGRERNTSEFKITSAKPMTSRKIIKQFQIEIFKTKVPYMGQDLLRDKHKKPNRQTNTNQENLHSYKYLKAQKSGGLSESHVSYTESPKSSINIEKKNRKSKNAHYDRQVELFNAYDNTDDSDSFKDDGRKNDEIMRKTNYESSYSDQESHLKANLKAALFHGLDIGLNRRMLNADVNEEHAKLNLRMLSPSSGSDEEHLIKSNIYKSFGYRNAFENETHNE